MRMENATILLVEDNPGDVRLTREALKEAGIEHQLRVVRDGVEALRYLRREGEYASESMPDLMMLDWNLPRKNGREVLAEVKNLPGLRRLPVIILTSSESESDIRAAYNLHANCYITKPIDHDNYSNVVRAIQNFWFSVAKLPSAEE